MFTGIVETTGRIVEISPLAGARRVGIVSETVAQGVADGDSVAVDGVCLTVVGRRLDRFYADVVPETLRRTTLGEARKGMRVNLERSLRLGDRLGGHLVQGHVDAVAVVRGVSRRGGDRRLQMAMGPEIQRYVAPKGSITLHGVSLTLAGVDPEMFEVALIPETLARTTLGQVKAGDRLNVEVDLIARYLESLLTNRGKGVSRGGRSS